MTWRRSPMRSWSPWTASRPPPPCWDLGWDRVGEPRGSSGGLRIHRPKRRDFGAGHTKRRTVSVFGSYQLTKSFPTQNRHFGPFLAKTLPADTVSAFALGVLRRRGAAPRGGRGGAGAGHLLSSERRRPTAGAGGAKGRRVFFFDYITLYS